MFIKRNPKQSSVIKLFVAGIPIYFIPEYYNAQTGPIKDLAISRNFLMSSSVRPLPCRAFRFLIFWLPASAGIVFYVVGGRLRVSPLLHSPSF